MKSHGESGKPLYKIWSIMKERCYNRNNSNFKYYDRLLTAFGETKSITEWTEDERCKATNGCLRKRLDRNWKPEIAITFP